MLACRACRVPVAAPNGCALCAPIKRHLVDADADGGEVASLTEVGQEAVAALRDVLSEARRIRRESTDDVQRLHALNTVVKVSNSLAKVLEAGRKLQADGAGAIRAMSHRERAGLFVEWYTELPPSLRGELRAKMDEFEAEIARPLELA